MVHNCNYNRYLEYNQNYYIEVRFFMACVFGEVRTLKTVSVFENWLSVVVEQPNV